MNRTGERPLVMATERRCVAAAVVEQHVAASDVGSDGGGVGAQEYFRST